jgi:hypothetical protein
MRTRTGEFLALPVMLAIGVAAIAWVVSGGLNALLASLVNALLRQ